jgi:hypothetical protein
MTVRRFIEVYSKVCSYHSWFVLADGHKCSQREAARIYDDSATTDSCSMDIEYQHKIEKSLMAASDYHSVNAVSSRWFSVRRNDDDSNI